MLHASSPIQPRIVATLVLYFFFILLLLPAVNDADGVDELFLRRSGFLGPSFSSLDMPNLLARMPMATAVSAGFLLLRLVRSTPMMVMFFLGQSHRFELEKITDHR